MRDYVDLRVAVQEVAAFKATGFRQVDVDLNLVGPDLVTFQVYASEKIASWMPTLGYSLHEHGSVCTIRKPRPSHHYVAGVTADASICVSVARCS